jgi:hypothetical protein
MLYFEDSVGIWTLCGYLVEIRGRQYVYVLGKKYDLDEYCDLLKNSLDLDVLAKDFE